MKVKYIRVSSIEQNESRQTDLSLKNIIDKCSGSVAFAKRPKGGKLLKQIKSGKIKELHVHSIDRLGRNVADILNTIEICNSVGCCVYSSKEGIKTLNEDGSKNYIAALLVAVLGSIAEFELNRIRERTQEGRIKAKQQGRFTGRTIGSVENVEVFLNKRKNKYIAGRLRANKGIRETARLAKENYGKCSISLVQKVAKLIEV